MKRNFLIVATMLVTIVPYVYIIPQLAEMNLLLYHVYLLLGMLWATTIVAVAERDGNLPILNRIVTWIINMFCWPSCMILAGFSMYFNKRISLF